MFPFVAFATVICTVMVTCSPSPSASATLQLLPPDPRYTMVYRAPPSYDFPRRHQVAHKTGLIIVAKQPHPLSSSSAAAASMSRYKPKYPHKTTTPPYPTFSGQWQLVTPEAPPTGVFETQVVYNEDGTRILDENPPNSTEQTTVFDVTTVTITPEVTSVTEDTSATVLAAEEMETTTATTTTTTTTPPKTNQGSLLGKLGGSWLTNWLGNLIMSGRNSETPAMTSQLASNRFGRPLEDEGVLRGTNYPFRASMEGWRPMTVEDRNQPPSMYSAPDEWVTSDPGFISENPAEHLRIDSEEPPLAPPPAAAESELETEVDIATKDYEYVDGDDELPITDPQLLTWFLMARKPPMEPTEMSEVAGTLAITDATLTESTSPSSSLPSTTAPSSTPSTSSSSAAATASTSPLPSASSELHLDDVTTETNQTHHSNGGNAGSNQELWVISEKLPGNTSEYVTPSLVPVTTSSTITATTTTSSISTDGSTDGPVPGSYERKRAPLPEHVAMEHLKKMHNDLSSHVTSLFPFLAPLSHVKLQL